MAQLKIAQLNHAKFSMALNHQAQKQVCGGEISQEIYQPLKQQYEAGNLLTNYYYNNSGELTVTLLADNGENTQVTQTFS